MRELLDWEKAQIEDAYKRMNGFIDTVGEVFYWIAIVALNITGMYWFIKLFLMIVFSN